MECLACHTPNIDGARFCAKCGAPLPVQKAADADPLIGKTIGGRYAITGILGEGGMGRVYTAEQRMGTSIRKVAVKTLLAQFAKDPQTVARFMREVGTVSELEHPNTIKVYDFGQVEDTGELYIAMEFLQGQSLDDLMTGGQAVAPERVDRILGQTCGSLQEAHEKGVVHRDLKPANIFLTTRAGEEDYVKVLDFGIAKKADSKDSKQEQKLTQQGTILGTPPYMSPEQFTGKELDLRSDIYSLGVITYEMLTGRLPFEADTPWQWMTQHMSGQPFPFESTPAGANVPFKMKQAVLRALAKDPAQRPQTARDYFEELTLGATRMSAVGLGTGGIAAMPHSPSGGTAAFQAPPTGAGRAGGTQVGEPLFPDAPPPAGAPGGASRTVIGTDIGGHQPYVAGAHPAVPTGGGQAVPAPPPAAARSGGGPNLALIGLIGFVVIGGGVGGFFYWKGRASADDGPTKTIPVKSSDAKDDKPAASSTSSGDPTSTPSTASATTSASAAPSASATASASAAPSASATASAAPSATATASPSTKPTATSAPQQGIDSCCARVSDKTKRTMCNGMNARIKAGTVNRSAALATLSGQGVRCN